jgi:hypothetical protein
MVDRIDNSAQFTLNGVPQGPPIDISGMAGKTLYAFADSWYKSGPVATINGGANGFAEQVPAGYTALDGTTTSDEATVPVAVVTQEVQAPGSFSFMAGGASQITTSPTAESGSTSADTVTVDKPGALAAGLQTISGAESDPSQPVYLDWHTYGTPAKDDSDWAKATVKADGSFSARVSIDHPGIQSAIYDYVGTGSVQQAWVAAPH